MFSSKTDKWATPQEFYDKLNNEFHFTLDPCADETNHKCDTYFTEEQDGLKQDWSGHVVFCNPPYGNKETGMWTQKCYEEAQKENTTVVLLIPARTDRKSFHEYVYNKPNVEIRFIRGRLKFGSSKDSAPFPSMVVVFR
jgi:phage N-6-adenine-methyltransferase